MTQFEVRNFTPLPPKLISRSGPSAHMQGDVAPMCPACQSNLALTAKLRDMAGYQLVFCGKCGFTVGAVNYF